MKTVLIDNYDSFTYNLVPMLYAGGASEVSVMRNDQIDVDLIRDCGAIVISPGPGLPDMSGDLMHVLRIFAAMKPVLGICLGLQAVAEHFGGTLLNLDQVVHGKPSSIHVVVPDDPLYRGIKSPFAAGRYHSWVADASHVPDDVEVTAVDETGTVMSLRHKGLPVFGVQYHPESVMTPDGGRIVRNFIKICMR